MPKLNPSALYYGGDYNPEQWSRDVWQEDIRLMKQAKVNLVSLGIFSWTNIEVAEGVYQFDWLDDIINLLHENDIKVDLATATASPPAWLTKAHPEMLPIDANGVVRSHGGRQNYCTSSPIYRERAAALVAKLAERYGDHPAVEMWHVNNEFGCHNPLCFCDTTAVAWQGWLQNKYGNLEALNEAWATNFWSQRYHNWNEIIPPRRTPDGTFPNPSMVLDFHRFSSDELLDIYKLERDTIRKYDSVHPITTNFMSMRGSIFVDYWKWAKEVDFVSTDIYLIAADPNRDIEFAYACDLTRGFANGQPWLLMEHSTSAVNWQEHNLPKEQGEMLANSIGSVARGSEGAMYFQWRQSKGGSEKFHSAMVPHAGENTRVYRQVTELGDQLDQLRDLVSTSTEQAKIAIIHDYESLWAMRQYNVPTTQLDYTEISQDWYRALYNMGVRVDFVSAKADRATFKKYDLVLAPTQYLMTDELEANLIDYVKNGGSLVASYFTGISNETDLIRLGGYGGKLVKDFIGVRVEEFAPLPKGSVTTLSNGYQAKLWAEISQANGAEVLATFGEGVAAGSVAIARRNYEKPVWYVASQLTDESLKEFFGSVTKELGIEAEGGNGTEVLRRGKFRFEIGHKPGSHSHQVSIG